MEIRFEDAILIIIIGIVIIFTVYVIFNIKIEKNKRLMKSYFGGEG